MKKSISIIILMILIAIFIIPSHTNAAGVDMSKYTSEDLVTTFNTEGVTNYDLTKYNTANSKRVNIYIFRGDGCINCKNLYTHYIAPKLLASHGDKIKIISYEVKNNRQNYNLLDKAKTLLNEQAASYATPTVIIGNKTFSGDLVANNAAQIQAEIESAIDALYNSNNRYDIIEELAGKLVFTDNTNNITFTSNTRLDTSYVLKTTLVDNSAVVAEEGYTYITSYDIAMYNGTVIVPLTGGSYKIKIPITDRYDTYKVSYIENGIIKENFNATYSNNYIEFTTTHLSEYAVYGFNNPVTDSGVDKNQTPSTDSNTQQVQQAFKKSITEEPNPQTSDKVQFYIILLILGSITLLASIILFKKKI